MSSSSSLRRREFLASLGAMAAATVASSLPGWASLAPTPLYLPMDLSYLNTPTSTGPADIRIGYAAITWGGNDRQAIEDIAALGFRGIQLRSNCTKEFASPAALRDLLAKHNLQMVALSSGDLDIDPARESAEIATHVANAKFLRDVGGLYLQVIDVRPRDHAIAAADYKRLGQLLTELGKRTADLGIALGYHNHMGGLGEEPEGVDQILAAADPRYARLELDIAHYFQGDGDPVKAIEKYHDRLLFLHIKDVEKLRGNRDSEHSYRFVELGRGQVNIPAVFDALRRVNFRGWAIVELDEVPDKARSPKQSAMINKKYLEEKLKLTV